MSLYNTNKKSYFASQTQPSACRFDGKSAWNRLCYLLTSALDKATRPLPACGSCNANAVNITLVQTNAHVDRHQVTGTCSSRETAANSIKLQLEPSWRRCERRILTRPWRPLWQRPSCDASGGVSRGRRVVLWSETSSWTAARTPSPQTPPPSLPAAK